MCIDGLNFHDNPTGKNKVSLLQWKDCRIELKNGQNIEVNVFNYARNKGESKAFTIRNVSSITHSLLQIFLRRLRKKLFYGDYMNIDKEYLS